MFPIPLKASVEGVEEFRAVEIVPEVAEGVAPDAIDIAMSAERCCQGAETELDGSILCPDRLEGGGDGSEVDGGSG